MVSLKSVDFYSAGGNNSVAALIGEVIGKMSRVVTNAAEIAELKLKPIAPGIDRAFLVEEFNKILVTECSIENFRPGIEVFIEKPGLLPFEEAKLYGHNAIHALLAYLGVAKGYEKMTELKDDVALMAIAHNAFINESGQALIKKYESLNDELFTRAGFKEYAEDLLERMTNQYLQDTTERAGRDPIRKLGSNDRIFGTMNLAIDYGIEPLNMAYAAAAGIQYLLREAEEYNLPGKFRQIDIQQPSKNEIKDLLLWVWDKAGPINKSHNSQLIDLAYREYSELPKSP